MPVIPSSRSSLCRANIVSALVLISLTAIAFWRTLWSYFLSDDFVLLRHARSLAGGLGPLFTTGGGDGFFRPIGYISLALSSQWAGSNPVLWHAMALAIHGANAVLVFMLALSLGRSRNAAIFGAALFAIHGTRPEVALWVAGRFDLLSAFFVLGSLLLFIRSQAGEAPSRLLYAVSLVTMIFAILTKESAFIFPVLLVVLMFSGGPLSRRRIIGLIPFLCMAAALFVYRWILFHGIGGYREALTGQPQTLHLSLVHAVEALLLRVWAALFFPINWSREPGWPLAALMVVYVAALIPLAFARVRRAEIVFPVAFVLVTALPPLHLLLIGPDLGKSRLLYLPSIGFSLALACSADSLKYAFRWAVPVSILAFHFCALQHNLGIWRYASSRARSAIIAATNCVGSGEESVIAFGLPGALGGVPFFANGFPEALALERGSHVVPVSGSASSGTGRSCQLAWDNASEELRVVR